jgi:hypothetical protein
VEDERVADGPKVAKKRSNVRGAQDLRRRIYVKAKAEIFCGFRPGNLGVSAGGGGVGKGCRAPCGCSAAVGISIFF